MTIAIVAGLDFVTMLFLLLCSTAPRTGKPVALSLATWRAI